MKEVLSLITFGIGALFFVVFFAALKPDVVIAFPGQGSQPGYATRKLRLRTLAARTSLPQHQGPASASDSEYRGRVSPAYRLDAEDRTSFAPETTLPMRNERDQTRTKTQQNQRSSP